MSQVVTKTPTSYQVIVDGWANPQNAYSEDGVYTSSSTNNSEVKYGGWNFSPSDIPNGSTITKVELGAKHYETNPSGYVHYTVLKYVDSNGGIHEFQLPNAGSPVTNWFDITSYESGWDLSKLNNADCRIKMIESAMGGCYSEHTYFIRLAENNEKEFVNVKDVKVGDMLYAYLQSEDKFDFVRVKEVRCVEAEEWITLYIIPHFKRSKTKDEFFSYQAHFTFTAEHPHWVWHQGVEQGKYVQMSSKQIWEYLKMGFQIWLPCKITRLSEKMVNVPIQRADRQIRKAIAYNIVLERKDALLSLEEFHPNDLDFLKEHGFSMARFIDEFPLPVIKQKETAYVDVVFLRVTFTPPPSITIKKPLMDGFVYVE